MSQTNDLVISHTWYEETSTGDREFLVSAELWCPANSKTPNSLRKPPVSKRVSDKRESIGGQANAILEEKRLREKPSWFKAQAQGSSVGGQWLPASCKLSDEGDRCMLNIYVGETYLQDSIYVHLLRCTDIRQVDRSLFFHSNVLGLHVRSGQRLIEKDAEEHVYLRFRNTDSLSTWVALLRSYAIAEIYGKRLAIKPDGGLYRMWRQVFLEVSQVRNLGSLKSSTDPNQTTNITSDTEAPGDSGEMEVTCEICINDSLCGRSTSKKGIGSLEWHEQFTFSDLPPFGELAILVYREKRMFKSHLLGKITIVLPNFRRGQVVEAWYPIIHSGPSVNGIQVGEMRLKIKVDEEIVLPMSSYKPMLECFSQGNMLDHLTNLEQELKLEHAAEHIVAVSVINNVLERDLFVLAEREVANAASAQNTLFRGNSVLTKTIEIAMNMYGKSFLEASIGSSVRRLCADKIAIETDSNRGGKGKDQEKNTESLVYWCSEFWKGIYAVRTTCPSELRSIFHHIRQVVEKRYSDNRVMRWQSVSAFCFLRFIVPGILHPHLFGLCHGMPSAPVQRSLTLVAKALQSLANLNTSGRREELTRGGMKEFMEASLPAMTDYIDVVSTPKHDVQVHSNWGPDEHERIQVMNSLRERAPSLPTLHREAILFLPHLIDLPKHLAILTSGIVRCSNKRWNASQKQFNDSILQLVKACNAIEHKAVKHVSRLKRPNRTNVRRMSRSLPQSSFDAHFTPHILPDQVPVTESARDDPLPHSRSQQRRSISHKNGRPSTAPSDATPPPPVSSKSRLSNETTTNEPAPPSSMRRLQRRTTKTQNDYGDRRVSMDAYYDHPQPTTERTPSDTLQSSNPVPSLPEELKRPNAFMRLLTKR